MASDFTGTNSEKIDKLIATVVELRTTLRICFAIIGVGFPLMIRLLALLVLQSFSTSSKIDRLNDRISVIRDYYESLNDLLNKLDRSGRP